MIDETKSCPSRSVRAYEDAERVRRYDRDMDLMHPNRHRMVGVALELLSDLEEQPTRILELGIGTAFFAARFLERHPLATLVGVDGSASMIELARARLKGAGVADRAELVTARFEDFDPHDSQIGPVGIVFSSYALHHLSVETKRAVLSRVFSVLTPGGWFLNADLVSHPDPAVEEVIQRVRVDGIVARNAAAAEPDPRFSEAARVRAFLDGLEENEGDNPLSVKEDLALIRDCGIKAPTVFWKEYRETVMGGRMRK